MPVTHDALVARLGLEIGISPQKVSDFHLNGLRQQGSVRPDPELHQKEQSATSAGSRRERVCLC
jgi:hypothetical protein